MLAHHLLRWGRVEGAFSMLAHHLLRWGRVGGASTSFAALCLILGTYLVQMWFIVTKSSHFLEIELLVTL